MVFSLYINQKVLMACNVNCLFKTEGHFKVVGSHVRCSAVTSRKLSLLSTTNRKRFVAVSMTLSDLKDRSFKPCQVDNVAIDQISTVIARCVVPVCLSV